MATRYYPFDSGQGGSVTELEWSKMASQWTDTGIVDGVMNELEVYANTSGMQVFVKTGAAWIKGHYFESDEEETLPIAQADLANPRIDRVIVRLDWTVNRIEFAVLQGTPQVTPTAPALTQNTSRWEIPLSQVTVDAGAVSISADKVKNEGYFSDNYSYTSIGTSTSTKQTLATGVVHKLLFNRGVHDSHGQFDSANNRFLAKKDGMYQVNVSALIETPVAYCNFELQLYRNGQFWSTPGHYRMFPGSTSSEDANINVTGSLIIPLAAGDYLELYMYVGASSTGNRFLSAADTRFNYFNVVGIGGRKYDN